MNATNLPGFTAETSLFDSRGYQVTAEGAGRHGLVTPAALSDEIDLEQDLPFAEFGPTTHGNCLKRLCVHTHEYYPGLPVCDRWIWIWGNCWP